MSVYEVIDMVRTRPPTFLGDYRIHSLQNLVAGMHWAGAEDGGNPYKDFTNWYCLVVGTRSTFPWTELEAAVGDRGALESFFEHLDRFRACTLTDLAISSGPFILACNIQPIPATPSTLCISQYMPSPVFVLRELSVSGDDLNEDIGSECFSSLAAVREHAHAKWSTPLDSWRQQVPFPDPA